MNGHSLFNFCVNANKAEENALALAKSNLDREQGAYTYGLLCNLEKARREFLNEITAVGNLNGEEKLRLLDEYKGKLITFENKSVEIYGQYNEFFRHVAKLWDAISELEADIREAHKG